MLPDLSSTVSDTASLVKWQCSPVFPRAQYTPAYTGYSSWIKFHRIFRILWFLNTPKKISNINMKYLIICLTTSFNNCYLVRNHVAIKYWAQIFKMNCLFKFRNILPVLPRFSLWSIVFQTSKIESSPKYSGDLLIIKSIHFYLQTIIYSSGLALYHCFYSIISLWVSWFLINHIFIIITFSWFK